LVVDEDLALVSRRHEHGGLLRSVAMVSALLLAVVATAAATSVLTIRATMPDTSRIGDMAELDGMMVVKPPPGECAASKEDCMPSRCCAVTGNYCFKGQNGKGKCMKECTPGGTNGTCEGVAPHMAPIAENPGLSLFCFAVYTENTGNTKPNYEFDLLKKQYEMGISLFSCADWAVYADVEKALDDTHSTEVVHDVKGDWHLMKRKETNSWVNTGMFVQVWLAVQAAGKYANHNWVVKVDADAVFFPYNLGNVLATVPVPSQGLYIENCKYVDWGYFGNLEVFSRQAFQTLVDKVETCYTEIDWKTGIKGGKYGATGEDLFAQQCMDLMKVSKVENFALSMDGACEADRPADERKNKKFVPDCNGVSTPSIHPFKKVEPYVKCWMAAKDVSN